MIEETNEEYHWSPGQRQSEDLPDGEPRDSPCEMYHHNSKKNIDFHSRDKVSMLGVAAYTQTRRQIQSRGYAGNFDIGFVTPGASLTPEQVEQSKVSK